MNEVDTGRDRATEKGLGRLVGRPKLSKLSPLLRACSSSAA